MALNGLMCADVPLSSYSLTKPLECRTLSPKINKDTKSIRPAAAVSFCRWRL